MLHFIRGLENYKLGAQDGEVGRTREFYFDDQTWTVRYLVADTGTWMPGRQVLISPFAIEKIDEKQNIIHVSLTQKKIEDSPPINADKPVSRQYEVDYHAYYGWPMYWYGPALWGPTPYPVFGHAGTPAEPHPPSEEQPHDPHLRTTREVQGYRLHARDGEIGHVDDFILDDENWNIRYLVADTHNWWPGKHVPLSTEWIEQISWDRSMVYVNVTREGIQTAPEYKRHTPINREYEIELFKHYDRKGYWLQEPPS